MTTPLQQPDEILRPAPIRQTIARLRSRIEERFPGASLVKVACGLESLGGQTEQAVDRLGRPLWILRVSSVLAVAGIVGIVMWAVSHSISTAAGWRADVGELLQSIDAALNELIFLALTVYFFGSLETRVKRRTALKMLHRLRSIAHVVDMHQLTKDPEHALHTIAPTASSPERTLTREELVRYLNYSSEMLALISKLAALFTQPLQDPIVLDAVNDIETLTADLSRKIWQKITILDMYRAPAPVRQSALSP